MKSSRSEAPQRRRTALTLAIVLVAAGAAAVLVSHRADAQAPAGPAAVPAIPVPVAEVKAAPVAVWREYSGRLEAVQRVELRPRVAGTLQALHFREGALVRQGDLLITLDPAPYAAAVDRAAAQLAGAQARLRQAQTEQARATRLLADHAIAQREFDARDGALREAEADLGAAQAALRSAQLDLGYTQVRAPVAGRIGALAITPGNQVAAGPGAPVLATLVSVSPIYVGFDVDEQALAQAVHDRAQLAHIPVQMGTAGQDGTPLRGHLQLVDNHVDAASGTVRLRAVFDNGDGSLMPGQFARIRLGSAEAAPALLVSERAVGTDQSKRFVLVVSPDNKAEYREIQLGAPANGLRIVTAGLKAGERIVVNGLQRVRPGALLAPQPVAMDAKADTQASANAAPRS